MSTSETLLLVTWVPMRSTREITQRKFRYFIKKLKITTPSEWKVKYDKEFGNIHAMKPIGRSNIRFAIGTDNRVAIVARDELKIYDQHDLKVGVLAMELFKDVIVTFPWGASVCILRNNNVIWECKEQYCYQTRSPSLWCSFSRMIQLCNGHLYFVARDNNKLIHVDLNILLPKIDAGKSTPQDYEVIDTNVLDVALYKTHKEVYYVKAPGKVFLNKKPFCVANDPTGSYNCITKFKKCIIMGSYTWGGNHLELFNSKAEFLDSTDVGKGEIMHLTMFEFNQVVMAIVGQEFRNIDILAIHNKKIHVIEANKFVMPQGDGLICGVLVSGPRSDEIIIHGTPQHITSIRLSLQ